MDSFSKNGRGINCVGFRVRIGEIVVITLLVLYNEVSRTLNLVNLPCMDDLNSGMYDLFPQCASLLMKILKPLFDKIYQGIINSIADLCLSS